MKTTCERFLDYVRWNTMSDENSQTVPSTPGQMDFAKYLAEELKAMGIEDVRLDEKGYIYGSIPSNVEKQVPVIGFLAHVDTSEAHPSVTKMPRVIENYDGGRITLESGMVLDPEKDVSLSACSGQTLLVTDGYTLLGGDDTNGAAALLAEAEYALSRIARYSDNFSSLQERLTDLKYQVQDLADEVRDARDDLSYSADELEQIEARLDVIHRLRRKYGATCQDILCYLEQARKELDEIEFADDRVERLKKQLVQQEKLAWDAALALRKDRQEKAERMSAKILTELSQLDMPKVQFACSFRETELTDDGADSVAFYLSANAGEAMKPLSKVASGGELARIMLSMKNVLAEKDQVGTLIFDEVDTGVSGRAAQRIAEKLRSLARHKQVLCVTHLPQMAALADTHMLISKSERDGRTFTTVTPLDREGRKQELARIIGGTHITETTLRSAEEMLPDSENT